MNFKYLFSTYNFQFKVISFFCRRIIFFILPLFFFTSTQVYSQIYENELWSGLSMDLPITKKLDFSLEYEMRRNNDIEFFDWNISDVGLSYSFNKELKLSASYNYRSGQDRWQHVFNSNFYYDNKFWKIKYAYRLRYQEKYKNKFEWNNEGEKRIESGFEFHLRNRFILSFDTDTWLTPFTGCELYYLIGHESYPKKIGKNLIITNKYSDRFDVFRLYLGFEIDTFKDQKLSIYYMAENEFNIEEPKTSNVLGIFYSINLPRFFKF